MSVLTQRQQSLIRSLATRHGRKKSGLCLAEGVRCCRELFNAPEIRVKMVLLTPDLRDTIALPKEAEIYEVAATLLAGLSATVTASGILAVAEIPDCSPHRALDALAREPFLFALDQVGDPGNFGTMLRTARAAGLQELWYTAGSADPFGDKVIRSALAAQFAMRLREFPDLEELRGFAAEQGFSRLFLTDPHGGQSCFECADLFAKSVIVIGSEAHGIAPEVSGARVMIPMPGAFESLNAAQAATIILFEYVRRVTGTGC